MSTQPTLLAIRGKHDEWECSTCHEKFSGSKMAVVNLFGAHVRRVHKAPKPKEDFSQVDLPN
jgi:ribosomal protein L37AE/L43A